MCFLHRRNHFFVFFFFGSCRPNGCLSSTQIFLSPSKKKKEKKIRVLFCGAASCARESRESVRPVTQSFNAWNVSPC